MSISEIEKNDLPKGWLVSKINEIGYVVTGSTPSKSIKEYYGNAFPFFKPTDLDSGYCVWNATDGLSSEGITKARILPKKSILVTCIGATIGKIGFSRTEGACNQQINAIIVDRALTPEYVYFACISPYFQRQILDSASATTLPILNKSKFENLDIPIAPLNEQKRIVAKIEELFSKLDAGIAALERVQANLKRYRAAVLKAAVEGKLTEEWRKQNPNTEPASKLLQRILKDRRQKWESEQLEKYQKSGKTPPKDWQSKYKEPSAPDTANLPALPDGWCWATVEQVGNVQLGRQRSPQKISLNYPTKYIRAANLTEDGLKLDDVLDMEFLPNEQEIYRLHDGDILVSEASGSPDQVGKPVIWKGEIENCCFQNTVIRLSPWVVSSKYLLVIFQDFYFNKVFARASGGVGINHLSAGKFSLLPIPLAPLAEQEEISNIVEAQLSLHKQTKQQLEKDIIRSSRLRQSILKQAFSGKLVPQDPNDEPASILLQRIQAEKVNTIKAQPAKRQRKKVNDENSANIDPMS